MQIALFLAVIGAAIGITRALLHWGGIWWVPAVATWWSVLLFGYCRLTGKLPARVAKPRVFRVCVVGSWIAVVALLIQVT